MYVLFDFANPNVIIATASDYNQLANFLKQNYCIMLSSDHTRLFPAPLPPTE